MQSSTDDGAVWRRDLRLKVAIALAAKLLGLLALWYFFFRGANS